MLAASAAAHIDTSLQSAYRAVVPCCRVLQGSVRCWLHLLMRAPAVSFRCPLHTGVLCCRAFGVCEMLATPATACHRRRRSPSEWDVALLQGAPGVCEVWAAAAAADGAGAVPRPPDAPVQRGSEEDVGDHPQAALHHGRHLAHPHSPGVLCCRSGPAGEAEGGAWQGLSESLCPLHKTCKSGDSHCWIAAFLLGHLACGLAAPVSACLPSLCPSAFSLPGCLPSCVLPYLMHQPQSDPWVQCCKHACQHVARTVLQCACLRVLQLCLLCPWLPPATVLCLQLLQQRSLSA